MDRVPKVLLFVVMVAGIQAIFTFGGKLLRTDRNVPKPNYRELERVYNAKDIPGIPDVPHFDEDSDRKAKMLRDSIMNGSRLMNQLKKKPQGLDPNVDEALYESFGGEIPDEHCPPYVPPFPTGPDPMTKGFHKHSLMTRMSKGRFNALNSSRVSLSQKLMGQINPSQFGSLNSSRKSPTQRMMGQAHMGRVGQFGLSHSSQALLARSFNKSGTVSRSIHAGNLANMRGLGNGDSTFGSTGRAGTLGQMANGNRLYGSALAAHTRTQVAHQSTSRSVTGSDSSSYTRASHVTECLGAGVRAAADCAGYASSVVACRTAQVAPHPVVKAIAGVVCATHVVPAMDCAKSATNALTTCTGNANSSASDRSCQSSSNGHGSSSQSESSLSSRGCNNESSSSFGDSSKSESSSCSSSSSQGHSCGDELSKGFGGGFGKHH